MNMGDDDNPLNLDEAFELLVKEDDVTHVQGVKADFLTEDEQGEPLYSGPERRASDRRVNIDRRSGIRFNDKDDRRCGADRRKGNWGMKYDL